MSSDEKDKVDLSKLGNEVEVVAPGELPAVLGKRELPAEVKQFLQSAAEGTESAPEEVELQIIADILGATTLDDILAQGSVVHLEALTNMNVTILDWRWQKSNLADSIGFYQMWTVRVEGAEEDILVSVGSKACMAAVFAMAREGFLPVKVFVKKADKPTAKGYYPYRLLQPEKAFE